jgi:5'-nucleotidase
MASYTQLDFSLAAKVANQLAHLLLRNHILPTGTFLNVNVPAIPESETPRFAITRLGKRLRREEVVRRDDPKGRPYFWIGRRPQMANPEDGTDFSAIEKRMVSITPLQLDLTDHSFLPRLQGLVSNLKIE